MFITILLESYSINSHYRDLLLGIFLNLLMLDEIIIDDLDNLVTRLNLKSGFFKDKKFLVTGGAGFLGSWVCDVLIKLNAKVLCQDNFSSGLMFNIEHLKNNENFELIKQDVRSEKQISTIDGIIHMASRAAPEDYNKNQVETLLTNSEGIKNVLDLARKYDCQCLFTSTSEIYGDAEKIPTPEDCRGHVNSIGLRSCYDEGKRYGEALCMAYYREYGVKVKIVRIFNTYGPRIRPDGQYGRALSRFSLNALNNDNIVIYGDGLQTRSFCYVTDTILGILSFFAENTTQKVINLGNENEITINKLAEIIIKITNSKSKIIFKEKMPDDPKRRRPDISIAKTILRWNAETSLESGLEKTIKWILENKMIYE